MAKTAVRSGDVPREEGLATKLYPISFDSNSMLVYGNIVYGIIYCTEILLYRDLFSCVRGGIQRASCGSCFSIFGSIHEYDSRTLRSIWNEVRILKSSWNSLIGDTHLLNHVRILRMYKITHNMITEKIVRSEDEKSQKPQFCHLILF